MPRALALVGLLTLASAADAEPLDVRVAVAHVRGNALWGADSLYKALLDALKAEVIVVDPNLYARGEAATTGRRGQPTRVSNEGVAAAGKYTGASYVLVVEILKSGFLYTAHATLVNTANAEVQMDFRSGYYRPQAEAADRGGRIAQKAAAKIRLLKNGPPAGTGTATIAAGGGTATSTLASAGGENDGPSGNDDEIFGGVIDTPGSSHDAELFGGGLEGPGGVAETERRLEDLDSKVKAGGRMFLRLNYFITSDDVGNTSALNSPNILDLYVDARVNDRVRGYVQVRAFHDPTLVDGAPNSVGQPIAESKLLFDQLWLKFDIARTVFVTVGRQRVKWGVGRFWNPTDFLNSSVRDPLAVFDERLGVNLVKLHLPIESLSWNFYAIASLDDTDLIKKVGLALRAEILIDTTELSLSFNARKDGPTRFGADLSSGWGIFDFRAEGALTHNTQRTYYVGAFDPANGRFPNEIDRTSEWIPEAVLGMEAAIKYNDEDSAYLGLEYFYNGRGYNDAALYPYMIVQDTNARLNCSGLTCKIGAFQPLYMGRNYAAAYLVFAQPGPLNNSTFVASFIRNFDDKSMTLRVDYTATLLSFLSLSLFTQWHFGDVGEFRFGVDVPATPSVVGLEKGLHVGKPIVDIGSGLSINF
ncbi:MAG: hypothetical protein U1E65_21160 [Myxococcota bacterium]